MFSDEVLEKIFSREDVMKIPLTYQSVMVRAVQYPLMKRNCRQVVASGLRTRTRYKTVVETTNNSGFFRMIGEPCCAPDNRLSAINGESVPATTGGGE